METGYADRESLIAGDGDDEAEEGEPEEGEVEP